MTIDRAFNLENLNECLEERRPEEIIRWAIGQFSPRIALTSSFQTESVVLLHMISQINSAIQILFLETGYHFPETHAFKHNIVNLLGLRDVVDLKADSERREALSAKYQEMPYEVDSNQCCQINKVEPLDEALKRLDAWISGIRRSQSETRKEIKIVEAYDGGLFKINPLANVTTEEIWEYLRHHNLPRHPLFNKGYLSIGCWPCTKPIQTGDHERSGRWSGREKNECGIHTFMKLKGQP